MPIFTEGQDPLDKPGVNPAGRMPQYKEHYEQLQIQNQIARDRQSQDETLIVSGFIVVGLVVLTVGFRWLSKNRRKVAAAADSAAVSGLAASIGIGRNVQARGKSLMSRARNKADEKAKGK
jgi:hypothetical protein